MHAASLRIGDAEVVTIDCRQDREIDWRRDCKVARCEVANPAASRCGGLGYEHPCLTLDGLALPCRIPCVLPETSLVPELRYLQKQHKPYATKSDRSPFSNAVAFLRHSCDVYRQMSPSSTIMMYAQAQQGNDSIGLSSASDRRCATSFVLKVCVKLHPVS